MLRRLESLVLLPGHVVGKRCWASAAKDISYLSILRGRV